MKILLSPSKSQAHSETLTMFETHGLCDLRKSLKLFKHLKKMSQEELGFAMKLSGKLLEQTYASYQTFIPETSPTTPAILLYTGIVFKQLDIDTYQKEHWTYIDEHVRILSAMYGILHPFANIWKYRLDYSMSIPGLALRKYWSKPILETLKHEDLIFDLSSNEFGLTLKPLNRRIHQVIFLDLIDGKERVVSTNAKIARGKMIDFMIKNQIQEPSGLRSFSENGYGYRSERSDERRSVFLKQ